MAYIQPLELEKIFIQVFSGNPDIFGAIMLLVIAGLSAFFRMNGIGLFFMIGLFILMFSGYVGLSFLTILAIIGGLVGGYILSKIFQ